ncbi:MAG: hypothetical protein J0H25_01510 [Rhizobiales bacterium]|nr:hypothetical protein [Hyphomicrobiales bacterium]
MLRQRNLARIVTRRIAIRILVGRIFAVDDAGPHACNAPEQGDALASSRHHAGTVIRCARRAQARKDGGVLTRQSIESRLLVLADAGQDFASK